MQTRIDIQPISFDVLKEKYCKGSETTEDEIFERVATGVASTEKTEELRQTWKSHYLWMMKNGGVGAGRIMSAAGTDIQSTLMNCFVIPVGDAISKYDENNRPGIYEALRESAETLRRGGGVGYNFSHIRPKGANVKSVHSHASGPCSYMDIFDKSCKTVESAGVRRGAQMGVLRIDHPDVEEFIVAKREKGRWNNFNVSVDVSDEFMEAVESDSDWELVHEKEPHLDYKKENTSYYRKDIQKWVYKKVKARELWNTIMKSTYDFAEPGILFLDRANKVNNLRYCEKFEATNPCAEQPLPSYGCCDLGSINLTAFISKPFTNNAFFDDVKFKIVVGYMVRFLDSVLDLTFWPLDKQSDESASKRRIGVGFSGLGDALIMLGLKYGSDDSLSISEFISNVMRNEAYRASSKLAIEKGCFPLYNEELYFQEGTFASKLPPTLIEEIKSNGGMRNSHLLSIAPTGTISLAFFNNVSNGIEPAFSWSYKRRKRANNGEWEEYDVEDYAYMLYKKLYPEEFKKYGLPKCFVSALELSIDDHVNMLSVVQKYVDSSISKTVNIPADYDFESFKDLYKQAWSKGLKGLSTYRPNDTLGSILIANDEKPKVKEEPVKEEVECVDPRYVVIDHRPNGNLNAVSQKLQYYTADGERKVYLITSFMPIEQPDGSVYERAIEFFMPVGQTTESQQWMVSTMRMLSLAARGGFLERALEDMRKVSSDKGPIRYGTFTKEDGTVRPIWHDSEVALIAYAIQETIRERQLQRNKGTISHEEVTPEVNEKETNPQITKGKKCPECGAHAVIKKDGCEFCTACGAVGSCG